ncbi:acyl-CoA thioesterase [Paenibacillus thalictri]|uniref:Acyl-CoA thioesterase n=1 Tax=Paenibacillus thalictri TaxID=2527873 RepID=A0A4Q9DK45_9BACL|nr:thioesterase family protein [Paenibacillus thalictri]TBL75051.1 acyl-CoA thioesterase [Paenibacillus thalictri]
MWHKHTIRVRYQETDQMGVVYHANYLNWFEIGRTELIRALGMTYQSLEERGLLLPVTEANMAFRQPARYDDVVGIYTRIVSHSNVRLEFASEIRRLPAVQDSAIRIADAEIGKEGELLVSGGTRHVWVGRNWKPQRIDKEAPDLFALLNANKEKGSETDV